MLAEELAFRLIEARQPEVARRVLHVLGDAELARRIDREHVELMHLAKLGHQFPRGEGVANLPAGDVVGLAE
ncbi:MAG: hypothetical protein AW12_00901 [Candidatus Accumulibacter sp. BA-94]|nr:MAG: hypothetical protein AW12_00901 [Candidatus Accumulibacter sp. BA-94]